MTTREGRRRKALKERLSALMSALSPTPSRPRNASTPYPHSITNKSVTGKSHLSRTNRRSDRGSNPLKQSSDLLIDSASHHAFAPELFLEGSRRHRLEKMKLLLEKNVIMHIFNYVNLCSLSLSLSLQLQYPSGPRPLPVTPGREQRLSWRFLQSPTPQPPDPSPAPIGAFGRPPPPRRRHNRRRRGRRSCRLDSSASGPVGCHGS
jgi:hypothetical protein